jgi:hypothetical protein
MSVSYVKNGVRILCAGNERSSGIRKAREKAVRDLGKGKEIFQAQREYAWKRSGLKKEGQVQARTIEVDGTSKKSVKGLSA